MSDPFEEYWSCFSEKIRRCKDKTTHGVLIRPLQGIYPLQIITPRIISIPDNVNDFVIPVEFEQEENVELVKTRSERQVRRVI